MAGSFCVAYLTGFYGQPLASTQFSTKCWWTPVMPSLENSTSNEFDPEDWRSGGDLQQIVKSVQGLKAASAKTTPQIIRITIHRRICFPSFRIMPEMSLTERPKRVGLAKRPELAVQSSSNTLEVIRAILNSYCTKVLINAAVLVAPEKKEQKKPVDQGS